jgi:hypothetical protein
MKRYYYDRLNTEEQKAYRQLAAGLKDHQTEIDAEALTGGTESAVRVMDAVMCDSPGLCFTSVTGTGLVLSVRKISFRPTWVYAREEANSIRASLKSAAERILKRIPSGASDYDREKILHDYFVREMRYVDRPKEDTEANHRAHTVIGPLLESSGVCEGFAKAMTLLLRMAGVPAVYVRGRSAFNADGAVTGADDGHSWLCVQIAGKAYHLDVTWDNTLSQSGPVRYDYFNLSDADIALDHSEYQAPACPDGQSTYFHREGLLAASSGELGSLLRRAADNGAEALTFKLLPGRRGYPPDMNAALTKLLPAAGIVSCSIGLNERQRVMMLSSIRYQGGRRV